MVHGHTRINPVFVCSHIVFYHLHFIEFLLHFLRLFSILHNDFLYSFPLCLHLQHFKVNNYWDLRDSGFNDSEIVRFLLVRDSEHFKVSL